MDDYISREELKFRIRSAFSSLEDRCRINEIVNSIPSADVRPVVLCRDCVYYNTVGCADGFGWCEGVMASKGTSDDFFCAKGKQKPYECGAEMNPNLDTTKGDSHD